MINVNEYLKKNGNQLDKIRARINYDTYVFSSIQDFYNNLDKIRPKNGLIFHNLICYRNDSEHYYYDATGKIDVNYDYFSMWWSLGSFENSGLAYELERLSFGSLLERVYGKWNQERQLLVVRDIITNETPKTRRRKSLISIVNAFPQPATETT